MGPFLSHIPPFFVLENRREDIICAYVNCHNTHGSVLELVSKELNHLGGLRRFSEIGHQGH